MSHKTQQELYCDGDSKDSLASADRTELDSDNHSPSIHFNCLSPQCLRRLTSTLSTQGLGVAGANWLFVNGRKLPIMILTHPAQGHTMTAPPMQGENINGLQIGCVVGLFSSSFITADKGFLWATLRKLVVIAKITDWMCPMYLNHIRYEWFVISTSNHREAHLCKLGAWWSEHSSTSPLAVMTSCCIHQWSCRRRRYSFSVSTTWDCYTGFSLP